MFPEVQICKVIVRALYLPIVAIKAFLELSARLQEITNRIRHISSNGILEPQLKRVSSSKAPGEFR